MQKHSPHKCVLMLLDSVASSHEPTMTDLARKMQYSNAVITGLVDRLENLGYVERKADPKDRRKILVCNTPKGTDLLEVLRNNAPQ